MITRALSARALMLVVFVYVTAIFIIYGERLAPFYTKHTLFSGNSIWTALKRGNASSLNPANDLFVSEEKSASDSRIFMHETSGRPYLLWRQICSLESVARTNPSRPINLYMSARHLSHAETPWMAVVRQFKNVEVILIDNENYFKGSQLESWHKEREWQNSPFEISHMSNYIRMVTLSRAGGLYVDLDVIVFKELEERVFRNAFVYSSEQKNFVDTTVFHLETGHRLIGEVIELIASDYDGEADIYHGSTAVGKVLKDLCGLKAGKSSSNRCTDVTILPHSHFYPIEEADWNLFFKKPEPNFFANITNNYGIHTFLSITNYNMTDLNSNQLLAQLARKYCPLTVSKALLHHQGKL